MTPRILSAVRDGEESDQLPEEGPAQQVPDDAGGDARDEAQENPGAEDEEDDSVPGARDEEA